jgi:hypothetical protein
MAWLVFGVRCLLSFALLPDWFTYILLRHVSYQVTGLTESEAICPVQVSGGEAYLNSLLYHTAHTSCGLIQDGDAEIDVVPSLKSMLVITEAIDHTSSSLLLCQIFLCMCQYPSAPRLDRGISTQH